MATLNELAWLDATAQAELVRRSEVKPIELVEAAVERIAQLNPCLNAVVTPMYERARTVASSRLPDGPFSGVPFLLKDLLAAYADVRLTAGSAYLSHFVPKRDSELVTRLKQAGLIIVGKTSTPEFGLLPTTETRLFGPCRNPWDTTRTPGGSSGGSAAAVAAGMVPMAHGNDGGGSLRIPASCCGLFGFKPTRGRNPLGPDFGDIMSGLAIEHAVTRSVRDSAALLDVTAGPDLGDPYWAPPPSRPYLQEVGADPGKLRIAFSTETDPVRQLHPDCISAVQDVARLCLALGHDVEEATPAIDGTVLSEAYFVLFSAFCTSSIDGAARLTGHPPKPGQFEPLTWTVYQMGKQHTASDYLLALQALQRASRDIAKFFVDYDVWLTPTVAKPPVPLGSFDSPPENPLQGLTRATGFVYVAPVANITGQPAMSVPLFWNEEGLPIGTQFFGRFGDEVTLFRLAAQLEEARPWADKRPPVSIRP
jgi:amidase